MSMLGHAAEFFKARRTPIEAWYSDDKGRYAFRVTVRDERLIVCAKKYANHGRASFMKSKVLKRATQQDAMVALFLGESDRWLVWDPRQCLAHGEPSGGKSRRVKKGEDWLDVQIDWAVTLEAFLDGIATPTFEPSDDPTTSTGRTASDGRPDRAHDITQWANGGDA